MPTKEQYSIVKAQVESFKELGCRTRFEVQPLKDKYAPKIVIEYSWKSWRLCDEDWNIVSRQLAELYKNLNKRNRNG